MKDPIQWKAHHKDGTTLSQYEGKKENKYEDIDREQLMAFSLWKDDKLVIAIHFDPEQRLIYRKRVQKKPGYPDTIVYLAGWQQKVKGQNIQSISYVGMDGTIHLAGQWNESHPWFYSPQLLEFEK